MANKPRSIGVCMPVVAIFVLLKTKLFISSLSNGFGGGHGLNNYGAVLVWWLGEDKCSDFEHSETPTSFLSVFFLFAKTTNKQTYQHSLCFKFVTQQECQKRKIRINRTNDRPLNMMKNKIQSFFSSFFNDKFLIEKFSFRFNGEKNFCLLFQAQKTALNSHY